LFISIAYCIYAFFYDSIVLMALDGGITRFSFFTNTFPAYFPTSFDFLKFYLPLHSVFFLGAIAFRKLNFFKVLLSALLLCLSFAGIIYLIGTVLLSEIYTGIWLLEDTPEVVPSDWFQSITDNYGKDILYGILLIFIPIVLWIVGYFKLTEKEA